MTMRHGVRRWPGAVGLCLLLWATAGQARGSEAEIVVTGTRLPAGACIAACPSSDRLEGAELRSRAVASVETLLSRGPRFSPSLGETLSLANPGVATLDLRGLGSARTLVLVDGRRLPPFSYGGVVDVNMVPTALIRQVDVLAEGASVAYGSDAVAGVVNIRLDEDVEGLRLDASSRVASRGDGALRMASVTGGLPLGDSGHLVLSVGYTRRSGILQADRGFSAVSLSARDLTPGGNSTTTDPLAIANSFVADGNAYYQVAAGGGLVPLYRLYDTAPHADLLVPMERSNVALLGRYRLGGDVTLRWRGFYIRSDVPTRSAPTGTFGYPFTIRPDNALLSDGQRALLFGPGARLNGDGSTTLSLFRRFTEGGDRSVAHDNEMWLLAAGLDGRWRGVDWALSVQHGETRRSLLYRNDISYARTAQALDVVAGANGPACRDPSGGCVPLDLFGSGPVSAAALAFIHADGMQSDRTSQTVVSFVANGALPWRVGRRAGAFALGAEYRHEAAETLVNAAYGRGDLIGFGAGRPFPRQGYGVKELFGEVQLPLPHALDLEGGARLADYATAGTVGAWRGALGWTPVAGVSLRVGRQRSVRAPNLFERAMPRATGLGVVGFDPCAGATPANDARLSALCVATGAPQSQIGRIASPPGSLVNAFFGGNPALSPEQADMLTVGLTVQPRAVPGLSVRVQYHDLHVADAIDAFGQSAQNVVSGCYLVMKDAASDYCRAIARNPLTGALSGGADVGVRQYQANSAALDLTGIDLSASGAMRLGRTRLEASVEGTYVDSLSRRATPFASALDCAGRFGFACGSVPMPRWRHLATLDWTAGQVQLGLRWRHVGPVSADAATRIAVQRISPYDYLDASLTLAVTDGLEFRLGADNLLDTDPPLVGSGAGSPAYNSANTFPSLYEVVGTSVYLSASARF